MQLVRGIREYEVEGLQQLYFCELKVGKNSYPMTIVSIYDIKILYEGEAGEAVGRPEYIALSPYEGQLMVYPRPDKRYQMKVEYCPTRRIM